MLLLLDIGNTHTHVGLADGNRVLKHADLPSTGWFDDRAARILGAFAERHHVEGACFCSVVPRANRAVRQFAKQRLRAPLLQLTPATVVGIGIRYPRPETIGQDRLANAVAARHHYGAPVVVVDFGTAVTFDVVDRRGDYVGGIIAPGLAAMTDYLHEKTALLPRIRIREPRRRVGKSTEEAMLVGAVHGYRGLIRGLIAELRQELGTRRLPVVATGGYAELIAAKLPEISAVDELLTLEGLRLVWSRARDLRGDSKHSA
jgi:type III pantothenate kinase